MTEGSGFTRDEERGGGYEGLLRLCSTHTHTHTHTHAGALARPDIDYTLHYNKDCS